VTPLNLGRQRRCAHALRRGAGATALGLAFRGDGNGKPLRPSSSRTHAVAIQKWVGNGAKITGEPAPGQRRRPARGLVPAGLRAVATTIGGGPGPCTWELLAERQEAGRLHTDRDHPYIQGYLGLYVRVDLRLDVDGRRGIRQLQLHRRPALRSASPRQYCGCGEPASRIRDQPVPAPATRTNPVDWWPVVRRGLRRGRPARTSPSCLSVGLPAACHWCHVMAP